MSPESERSDTPAWKNLNRKIKELQDKPHLPPELVALVSAVARLALAAEPKVRFQGLERQELPENLIGNIPDASSRATGAPMLPPHALPVDWAVTAELAGQVLDIVEKHTPELAGFAKELGNAFDNDNSLLENACKELLNPEQKDASRLAEWAKEHPEAPHFLRFVAQASLMPSLVAAGRLLGERHKKDAPWQHGHCPVCGSQPLIGRLAGQEGARMHTCSLCTYEYRVPRMACPFCLADAAEGSEYYMSDDEPGYLLDVCASCKNYIKLADFRQYDRVWLPMLDDLASLTLDLYARQMGYTRPTLSAWGF